jgi:23S rRNA (guanosine2251-2'-O)-methyltransferase
MGPRRFSGEGRHEDPGTANTSRPRPFTRPGFGPRRPGFGYGESGPSRGPDRGFDQDRDADRDRGFDQDSDRRPGRHFEQDRDQDRDFDRPEEGRPQSQAEPIANENGEPFLDAQSDRDFEQEATAPDQVERPARAFEPAVERPPFRGGRPMGQRPFRERGAPPRFREPSAAPRFFEPAPPPPAGLLGEDEELVAGRHPVEEAFIARRKAIRLLVVPQRRQALEKLVLHATNLRIPIVEVEGGTLTSLAGFDGHQGIALVTDKRTFAGLDDLLARAIERGEPAFVLVLDSLEDPQNFGSLLRTAEAAGAHGIVYPTHRQAPLSAAAVKASAGAVEHLLLVPVDDLAEALTDLHVRGLRIVGSDADAPLTARQTDLRGPLAVVVGSEGQGLGPAVRRRCDAVVRIPMKGHVSSLNAAVAGSILLYEASSQRGVPAVSPRSDLPATGEAESLGSDDAEPEPTGDATAEATTPATADAKADAADAATDAPRLTGVPARKPRARKSAAVPSKPAQHPLSADPGATSDPGSAGEQPSAGNSPEHPIVDDALLPGPPAQPDERTE